MSSFHRRVGAAADVKELEYIAALHQTCMPKLRTNGTVGSVDILRFLKSRTNLKVSHEHALRIVRGLGGGNVGADVIQRILKDQPTPEQEETRQRKRLKSKIRVAGNLSVLRKRHSKVTKREQKIPQDPFGIQGQKGHSKKDHQFHVFHRNDNGHNDAAEEDEDVENPFDDVAPEDVQAEEYLDLVQITAILLMPTLARAGKLWKENQLPQVHQEDEPPTPSYRGLKGWMERTCDEYKKREQEKEEELRKSLDPKPSLISDVLSTMLSSVEALSNNETFPPINASLVRNLLLVSGEYERAHDKVLVEKMVEAASSSSGLLDEEAFVHALTGDLSLWNVGCEDDQTSTFFDVYGFESYREKKIVEQQQHEAALEDAKSQKVTESNARLSKAGLATQASGSALISGPAEDYSIEDNIVPSVVGYDSTRKITDMSMSAMSVITMDDSVVEPPKAIDDDNESAYKLDRAHTPLDIDFAIDTHSSIVLTVLIFFFFMCTSLVYAVLILRIPELNPQCGRTFGCTLGTKVITWMVFACILAGTGYLVIIPLSIGNEPTERSPRRLFLAFILGLIITWIPFAAVEAYKNGLEPPYSGPANTVNEPNYNAAQWVTRFIGTLTCLVLLWRFTLACIGDQRIRNNDFMRNYLSVSAVRGVAREKKAATRKINAMLENSHALNPKGQIGHSGRAAKDETMMNFVLRGESFEEIGGLLWTWKRLFSRKLFDEDGVWIMSRLIIIQVVQFFLILFYAYTGVVLVQEIAARAQNFQDELEPGYPDWFYTFVPTPQQAEAALYPAVGVGVSRSLHVQGLKQAVAPF